MNWIKDHGTKIEIDLEGQYLKGQQSVDEYLKQTAIINPHVTIIYTNPKAEQYIFPRATEQKPKEAKEIKPHPYGVELGILMKMMDATPAKTMLQFLKEEFSRVTPRTAKEILENSAIMPKAKPKSITRDMAEKLMLGIKETKIMNPPTDCIAPIGPGLLEKGIKKEVNAEFYATVTRPPSVYRGNPFIIECAIAYGGSLKADGAVQVLRFANRVPLLYQQGACGITDSIGKTTWRSYGLQQSRNNIPQGPAVILVHMASVWVPFTSEAKEALAHYPEIMAEVKLALQECGRQLSKYTSKKKRVKDELKKRSFIDKYIPHVSEAIVEILGLGTAENEEMQMKLRGMLEHTRGKIDNLEFDPKKNEEYDEEFAKIGKEEAEEEYDGEHEEGKYEEEQ
jgi:DNA topoisomerase-6 subunit B